MTHTQTQGADGAGTKTAGIGPQTITTSRQTCNGCSALETKEWSFCGENDDLDSGTSARCAEANRGISSYWTVLNETPKWCPALASPRADTAEPHFGYLFHNPDTGHEWSESHPIESGEVEDAEDVRPATAKALHELLIEAWGALEDARADLYAPAPTGQAGVPDSVREAAAALIADLDRSLVSSRDHAVIAATNASVKRLRALIAAQPGGQEDPERCIACAEPLKAGELVLSDASGGTIHTACCGPERESYTGADDGALGPNDPIPQGYVYEGEQPTGQQQPDRKWVCNGDPAQPAGQAGDAGIEATQITLGEGMVDITRIDHEGRTGVLFRPRKERIPFGEPGELPEGTYWPVKGDVVLWVSGEGPGVAIKALADLAPDSTRTGAAEDLSAVRQAFERALPHSVKRFGEIAERFKPAPNSTRTGAAELRCLINEVADAVFAIGRATLSEQQVDRAYTAAERLLDYRDRNLSAARPEAPSDAGISVDVQTMRTSAGADYYVRLTCGGRSVTPYKFAERYKAEYEAAHFAWIFGLRPDEPDLMAYDEASHPNDPSDAGYQDRAEKWLDAVTEGDPTDLGERRDRFSEEAMELVQSLGATREGMHELVDYVFDRPVGEPGDEMGDTKLCMANLASWAKLDMDACGEAMLARRSKPESVAKIRRKRSTRHGRGPLPGITPPSDPAPSGQAEG